MVPLSSIFLGPKQIFIVLAYNLSRAFLSGQFSAQINLIKKVKHLAAQFRHKVKQKPHYNNIILHIILHIQNSNFVCGLLLENKISPSPIRKGTCFSYLSGHLRNYHNMIKDINS